MNQSLIQRVYLLVTESDTNIRVGICIVASVNILARLEAAVANWSV